ncbi:hypothetical protein [Streptomyces sp. fd1-xmd]|uniref:hypothetical protein n=1 Tax=Streptomyces sp. fd1-xmd TaxID=1812480 RepID=UPI0013521091|nr:hypothetical protein [Streptomyces sp. fd1-xmd]
MGDTSARRQLAEELRALKASAVVSLAQIEEHGRKQPRPVKLGKSKLSGWLSGASVPGADLPFRFLIQFLNLRARRRANDATLRDINWWMDLREKAARERSPGIPAGAPAQSVVALTESRIDISGYGVNSSNAIEVLACIIEWADIQSPLSSTRQLESIVTSILSDIRGWGTPYRWDGDRGGTLLAFRTEGEGAAPLTRKLIENCDSAIRREWIAGDRQSSPRLRIFVHAGFCQIRDGNFGGRLFDEMQAQRGGSAFLEVMNGEPAGVVSLVSDAAFPSEADPVRDAMGDWVNFISHVDAQSPMRVWVRKMPPAVTPKCLLIARFSSDDIDVDRCRGVASEISSFLEGVKESPQRGWAEPTLEVGRWAQDGVFVGVLAERPAAFLVEYLLPLMTRRLMILGQRNSMIVHMNAGVHTVGDVIADDDGSFVTASRLSEWAHRIRNGLREGEVDATSVCLVSGLARSTASDNLMDVIDESRYIQIPEDGLEGSVDSWLYVPYAPRIV